MAYRKDIAQLAKQAIKQGWRVEQTKGGHLKWMSPNGGFTFSGVTPSKTDGFIKHKNTLRKLGFIDEHSK